MLKASKQAQEQMSNMSKDDVQKAVDEMKNVPKNLWNQKWLILAYFPVQTEHGKPVICYFQYIKVDSAI